MNSESRSLNHILTLSALSSVRHVQRPKISFVDSQSKFSKNKTKSPRGWTNWPNDFSPFDSSPTAKYSFKLPPIDPELRAGHMLPAISESSLQVPKGSNKFKARGSIMHEQPLSFAKPGLGPVAVRPRGSIVLSELQQAETRFFEEEQKRILGLSPAIALNSNINRKKTLIEEDSAPAVNAVMRCGYKTHAGSVMGKKKEHNQDSWLIEQKLLGLKGQYLFAVCDGHGTKGHKVSALIKQQLAAKVESALQPVDKAEIALDLALTNGVRALVTAVEASDIDLHFSGSTLVAVLIRGKQLVCANIGDSRAVIGTCDSFERWKAVELSSDHKPVRSDEARRITEAGGVIRQFQSNNGESIGPLRVWAREKDVPGLAMTRSIGDLASKKNGIIAEPEIREKVLNEEDKFLIIATDGVWEFISSQEAVEIVKDVWGLGKSEACCERLLEAARGRWEKENVEDDITIVVAFLNAK